MPVKAIIPGSLKHWFNGSEEALCRGNTLKECLHDLDSQFPGLMTKLISEDKQAPRVMIFINGENIRGLNGLDTTIQDGDELGIIPLAAGG